MTVFQLLIFISLLCIELEFRGLHGSWGKGILAMMMRMHGIGHYS